MNIDMTPGLTALRLGLSLLLGGLIGIEREIHGKSAGMRTHMLVALGSALFTIISFVLPGLLGSSERSDPTRIAAQVLTGVGFLGAGTILHSRGGIRGLTTAASIWLVAAIGMAAGGGFYVGAVLATLLGHVVLLLFWRLEKDMLRRKGNRRVVRAYLGGEPDTRWVEQMIAGLKSPPTRWTTEAQADGMSLLLVGRFSREELKRLLDTLHERGTLRELSVEKRAT